MGGFENAFREIGELVETFKSGIHHYKSSHYSEAQTRMDFIDNFWIALGWDVNHRIQKNPYEQEVKVERGVPVGGTQRRADYALYLAPNYHDVKFLVEAKKPAVDIATPESCFQLIRYGWNSGTPLAVLTDFEQLLVLDCRYKPDIGTAANQIIQKYYYTEYTDEEKLRKIYWLFSHEAVEQGSIEKRAAELPKPRGKTVQRGLFPGGYQSIDESFLAELDEHRMSLAKNFKNHNQELASETLTELAQRTLDRLVFLRFLEDKGIEPARLVENFGTKGSAWGDFIAASRRLDNIYNGIVYKHHGILDGKDFHVDDKAFSQIRDSLAHANSPYDFNSIPIHILGSIYERFLGKVIVATDKRAKVEEKPEVRKAGGVYYTPQYIVRYIVKNTVGKLIEGRTPAEIAKMRFADIACGSGSFLLAVYDLLLDYHGHYYNDHPDEAQKGDCVERDGKLYLTLAKKREILLNNIYGVDIDAQAVEVCQLSLYLKLLQDETEASAHQYLLDFARDARLKKLLPDLSRNIRCGNSLIGPDFYSEQGDLFDTKESRRINAFDWYSKEHGFGEIMSQGGFDAVIGNPPYIFTRNQGIDESQKSYFYRNFKHQSSQLNTFGIFVERAYMLLGESGMVGYITPNNWLTIDTFAPLRKFIVNNMKDVTIVNICDKVFSSANVDTAIGLFKKGKPTDIKLFEMKETKESFLCKVRVSDISPPSYIIQIGLFKDPTVQKIIKKIVNQTQPLSKVSNVSTGLKAYQTGKGRPPQTNEAKENRIFHSSNKVNKTYGKYLDGVDVRRYCLAWSGQYLSYGDWLAEPRKSVPFNGKRLLVRQIPGKPPYVVHAVFTEDTYYNDINSMVIFSPANTLSLKYFLGLINSKLLSLWFLKTYDKLQRKIFPQFKVKELSCFPIRTIDFNNKDDKKMHGRMVELVEVMLKLNKELHEQKLSERDREALERRIDYTDREIDKLVYKLYNLTDDEIKIVEGN